MEKKRVYIKYIHILLYKCLLKTSKKTKKSFKIKSSPKNTKLENWDQDQEVD